MEYVKTVEDLKDKNGEVYASNVEVFTLPEVAFEPSEALKAAISNGSVKTAIRTVEFPVKKDGKVTQLYRQNYTRWTLAFGA
jgi:hypothetical protein